MNGRKEENARATILGRVRDALRGARAESDEALEPSTFARKSGAHVSVAARLERFRALLQSVGGHVHTASSESDAAEQLARLFAEKGIQSVVRSDAPVVARLLARMPEPPIVHPPHVARAELLEVDAGLTSAQAAIAETGTLVLESDAERHRLASLVPPIHIAVLDERVIAADLDEALANLGHSDPTRMSRAVTLITGPSRTADIELTLVVGVHGPRELHVLCLLSP